MIELTIVDKKSISSRKTIIRDNYWVRCPRRWTGKFVHKQQTGHSIFTSSIFTRRPDGTWYRLSYGHIHSIEIRNIFSKYWEMDIPMHQIFELIAL